MGFERQTGAAGDVSVWFDSHCHITADRFDEDRAAAIARAREAGVDYMVAIGAGYGLADIAPAVALAESDPHIFATAGIHPHDASEWTDDTRDTLRRWLGNDRVVAVGECGLDYHYMNSPHEAQRHAFAQQVSLAAELDMPVSIHVRSEDSSAYSWPTSGVSYASPSSVTLTYNSGSCPS